MHYHQNTYVRNVTGLHSNYEHKRQIKAIKDCFINWKMIQDNYQFYCDNIESLK